MMSETVETDTSSAKSYMAAQLGMNWNSTQVRDSKRERARVEWGGKEDIQDNKLIF